MIHFDQIKLAVKETLRDRTVRSQHLKCIDLVKNMDSLIVCLCQEFDFGNANNAREFLLEILIKPGHPISTRLGPTNRPACPKCQNSSQNAVPDGSPHLLRCASCKTVFINHIYSPKPLHNTSKMLRDVVDKQVENDVQTGAVGIEEACFEAWPTKPKHFHLEGKVSKAQELRIVAICALVNDLHEQIEEVLLEQ